MTTKTEGLEATITRLRESKKASDKVDTDAGIEAGTAWAKNFAEYAELERLAQWVDQFGVDALDGEASPSDTLAEVINDDRDGDGIWDDIASEDRPRELPLAYVRGVAQGAMEVWHEVKDQI